MPMTRPSSRAVPWIAYIALSVYFTAPVLLTGAQLGANDWDALLLHHASVLESLIEYGQPPFWNPWYCGGDVLWQNPQVALLTPVYPLALLVGLSPALKLNVLLHYLVGFAGMHVLLTRAFSLRSAAWTLFIGSSFTLAGSPALHLAAGHVTFLPYFYLPWLLLFTILAVERRSWRGAVGAAAVLALTIWNGGIHIAVMSAVGLCAFLVVAACARREWRPIVLLATIGVLAVLLAAPKLVPVLAFLRFPGIVDIRTFPPTPDALSGRMLVRAFLDPFQSRGTTMDGQNYQWHEYGNYIGGLGALLIVASFAWVAWSRPFDRRHWLGTSLAVTAAVLLLVAIGEVSSFAPYILLRKLPLLSRFRLPVRYLLVFMVFATSLMAWVVRASNAEDASEGLRRWLGIALVVSCVFLAYRNSLLLQGVFPFAPLATSFRWMASPPAPQIDVRTDGFGADSPMLRAMKAGRAVLRCNEPLQLRGAVNPGKPVVFSDDRVAISRIAFSPNRVAFHAEPDEAGARVFLNQRYVWGWRSTGARLQVDPGTRLAYLTVPTKVRGDYAFSFFPSGLITGWALWIAGMAAAMRLWRRPGFSPASSSPPRGGPQS